MDFAEVCADSAGEGVAEDEAGDDSDGGDDQTFFEDIAEDFAGRRAEGHADAELAGAAADGEGEHAGDPDDGDEEGDGGESTKDQGVEFVGGEDFGADVLESSGALDGLVGGDALDGFNDGGDKGVGIARGVDEEAATPSFLIDGLVDGHGGVGDDVFVVEVGDDTDDAARVIADADEFHDAVGPAHGAADGFLAGEEVVGDALADDDDAVGSVFVGVAEVTAFEEGDAEGGEVSRRDRAEVGAEVFACVFAGGTFDGKGKADDECLGVAPGNAESGGDAADARESGDASDDVVVEVLHLLGRAAIGDDGEIDGQDV